MRLLFDRRDEGACTDRVGFPGAGVSAALAAHETTVVDLPASAAGTYDFYCGMGMRHGSIALAEPGANVEAPAARPSVSTSSPAPATSAGPVMAPMVRDSAAVPSTQEGEDAEAAERRGEIRDLARRVIFGAVLTAPVLFGVMAEEFFHPSWLPAMLTNAWFSLALIAPVMLWTGWPIHKSGWLGLAHRSPDMNTLITLGTVAAFGYSLVITLAPGLAPEKLRGVYYEEVGFILTLLGGQILLLFALLYLAAAAFR